MKTLLLIAVATLCFGATEPRVSRKALASVEGVINDKFRTVTADPYDLLGATRGTYLEGYGAVFTVELQLIYLNPITPFHRPYSSAELATMRERKLKKVPVLKEAMRALVGNAANLLETMPANEHISMEAILWHYSWEDSRDVPQRILMTV